MLDWDALRERLQTALLEAVSAEGLGHGLFTYAVVEGLEGKGGLAARKQISTRDLAAYVIKRVEQLAKQQKQEHEPQYF
jgi:uncharacterized caspase-like protein